MAPSNTWFVVDKEGLRKTLSRKGKAFAIYELLQNGYDENSTKLEVTLSEPKNGKSVLTCIDNAPNGYVDMTNAHTMFGESKKKADVNKRGRFNVGEKYVLALCDSASVTSKSGRVIFKANGTRAHDNVKTKVGTEFYGELPLTQAEYEDMVKKVKLVIPPVQTLFNGVELPRPKVLHEFSVSLPTEIPDENNILRSRKHNTKVRLYEVPKDKAYLYEMGMPVVPIVSRVSRSPEVIKSGQFVRFETFSPAPKSWLLPTAQGIEISNTPFPDAGVAALQAGAASTSQTDSDQRAQAKPDAASQDDGGQR